MSNTSRSLQQTGSAGVALIEPDRSSLLELTLPAPQVMTDFRSVRALVVAPDRHVDAALQDMVLGGVRALLVTEHDQLLGLLTAADIMGEKPIQFLQDPACEGSPCRHSDIHARDIMTPLEQLSTLTFDRVRNLSIRDIVEEFRHAQTTHLLVIQGTGKAHSNVRGIFSRSRIARECGLGERTWLA